MFRRKLQVVGTSDDHLIQPHKVNPATRFVRRIAFGISEVEYEISHVVHICLRNLNWLERRSAVGESLRGSYDNPAGLDLWSSITVSQPVTPPSDIDRQVLAHV